MTSLTIAQQATGVQHAAVGHIVTWEHVHSSNPGVIVKYAGTCTRVVAAGGGHPQSVEVLRTFPENKTGKRYLIPDPAQHANVRIVSVTHAAPPADTYGEDLEIKARPAEHGGSFARPNVRNPLTWEMFVCVDEARRGLALSEFERFIRAHVGVTGVNANRLRSGDDTF